MAPEQSAPTIHLPRLWKRRVKSVVLQVISLAHFAIVNTCGRAITNPKTSAAAELDRLRQEIALQREELRIKDARMVRVDSQRRPHYTPIERMAVPELRASRGWSMQQTADVFHVSGTTIATWMKRVDEGGPKALLKLRAPVNKFPDFVRYMVQRLKVVYPTLGTVKMAEILARAGLHLAPTTMSALEQSKRDVKPVQAVHCQPEKSNALSWMRFAALAKTDSFAAKFCAKHSGTSTRGLKTCRRNRPAYSVNSHGTTQRFAG